jgi:CBS domain-containing protein
VVREADVASVMTTQVMTARPETPFKDVVAMMAERGIGAVPVVDRLGRPVGVVSEADALAKQEFHGGHDALPHGDRAGRDRWYRALAQTAAELMTSPVRTVRADEPVSAAARLLAKEKVRRLFVLDDAGRLAGVVSRRDLLRVYLHSDEEIRAGIEALLASPGVGVPPRTVEVAVVNGVATVDGVLTGRRQAETVARAVLAMPGVVGMRNNLRYVVDDLVGHGSTRTGFRP